MPSATFIQPDSTRITIEVLSGTTLMHAAVHNNVSGILAECGGSAVCSTCHVYVNEHYVSQLPPPSEHERAILECSASECTAESRLSCQITMTEDLDGITLRIPPTQV